MVQAFDAAHAVPTDAETIAKVRWRQRVAVREPLVFISQLPRSGGTLLMSLLDGHPECHTVGHEFRVRYWAACRKNAVRDLDTTWQRLESHWHERFFRNGYSRVYVEDGLRQELYEAHPFLLVPGLHRQFFEAAVAETAKAGEPSPRDVMDAYLTGYFNAWLDNRNLWTGPKRWVTAFCPRRIVNDKKMARLAELYPDGRLISVVREPVAWYASARRWSEEWSELTAAADAWNEAAAAVLRRRRELGDHMLVLAFEDLLGRTEDTMGLVADWLGLTLTPGLLFPTFNGRPVEANSSFAMQGSGVDTAPLKRRSSVEPAEATSFEVRTRDLYEEVRSLCAEV